MSIRKLIIILVILMATAPLGLFIHSASRQHAHNIKQAQTLAMAVADKVITQQNMIISAAEQLAVTLSHVPAVKGHDVPAANRLLRQLISSTPQFSTIMLLEPDGRCWSAALPEQIGRSYADRRYFKNAVATGRFSAGEFTFGKVIPTPIFAFAYPMKSASGSLSGVISIVLNLDMYRQLYEQKKFSTNATSILLADHRGTVLFSSLEPKLAGASDIIFERMTSGPDEGMFESPGNLGLERYFTYKKLYLKGESTPYMYVRTGISKARVAEVSKSDLLTNVGSLTLVMLLTLGLAVLVTKREIHDKIVVLVAATEKIATGDLTIRVAKRTAGGELGALGHAFDEMAVRLSETIDELQCTRLSLQKSEEKLRLAFEGASDAIFWAEADSGILVNCNRAAEQMLGLPREEIIGRHQTFLHPPELRGQVAETFNMACGPAADSRAEVVVAGREGNPIPVEISHSVTTIGETRIMQGIFRDISERKRTEEELSHFQNLLAGIIDNSPFAIFVKDVSDEFRVILWNRAAEQVFGFQASEIIGRNAHDLWPKEMADAYLAEDLRAVEEKRMIDVPELASRNPLKGDIFIHTRKIPLMDQSGTVSHIVVISEDITERRLLQAEFIKNQKLESLGVLAGGIAHDFNNILTGVLGNISFAGMLIERGHKASEALLKAEKAAQRAADLAKQLLTFAKGGKPVKRDVAVRPILEESLSLVLRGTKVKGVLEVPEGLPLVSADEGQLHQVCNNIIINGVQAMPAGGILTVRAERALPAETASNPGMEEWVRITFSDTGCGIPEEDLKRVFDPYFTTKEGGSGLGLASAHSIITKHGGRIDVQSVPACGTTFELLLPAAFTAKAESPAEPSEAKDGPHGGGRELLVMDDEEMIRELVACMLGEFGYRVTTCASGEEAVELYSRALSAGVPYAAAIMDLTVPGGMGGKEAAALILQQDPDARLVVSSGYSSDPVMADYRAHGFSATMVKPYNAASLKRLLRELFA